MLTWDGPVAGAELPQTVDLEIVETAAGIKGASASARNKPATLSTGLVIRVPEYLSPGEKFVSISKNAVIWVVPDNFSRMQKRDGSGCPFFIYYTNLLFCLPEHRRPQFSLVD